MKTMNPETITIKLNGPLCARIEQFLQGHPEYGNLEEFVVAAGNLRKEQLAATLPRDRTPEAGSRTRDEEYSHGTLEAGWSALNRPLTPEEKTQILKALAYETRRLRASSRGSTGQGLIQ